MSSPIKTTAPFGSPRARRRVSRVPLADPGSLEGVLQRLPALRRQHGVEDIRAIVKQAASVLAPGGGAGAVSREDEEDVLRDVEAIMGDGEPQWRITDGDQPPVPLFGQIRASPSYDARRVSLPLESLIELAPLLLRGDPPLSPTHLAHLIISTPSAASRHICHERHAVLPVVFTAAPRPLDCSLLIGAEYNSRRRALITDVLLKQGVTFDQASLINETCRALFGLACACRWPLRPAGAFVKLPPELWLRIVSMAVPKGVETKVLLQVMGAMSLDEIARQRRREEAKSDVIGRNDAQSDAIGQQINMHGSDRTVELMRTNGGRHCALAQRIGQQHRIALPALSTFPSTLPTVTSGRRRRSAADHELAFLDRYARLTAQRELAALEAQLQECCARSSAIAAVRDQILTWIEEGKIGEGSSGREVGRVLVRLTGCRDAQTVVKLVGVVRAMLDSDLPTLLSVHQANLAGEGGHF